MTIRWLVVAICMAVALPIAVFLRSANASPAPQVVVVKVCNKPVSIYIIDKGVGTFYIVEGMIDDEDEMKKVMRYLHNGNVVVYRGEKWLGLNCPVMI